MRSSTLLSVVGLAATASAHGHVHYHVLGTETYTGYLPTATPDFTADAPSIVRRVGSDGPVELLAGDEMACNFNAVPILDGDVSRVGAVTAGTNITFDWHASLEAKNLH
ncbi:hypothetical protein V495_04061 [Pseudogymnoascus sp. VKM F-4514 (FW-929)]|nr:hypothetical protein V495_04061 [Pseudogymnoascus sp. VKM F-4514 (FW-929)]